MFLVTYPDSKFEFAEDGVNLEWWPTLALLRLQVRNMEFTSSANEGVSRQIFDFCLDPHESESQLESTRVKRLEGKAFRFSGEWSISSMDLMSNGVCIAQNFQEHVQTRLVSTNPIPSSIYYITFSYRRLKVFECTSPSNAGSIESTVSVFGYIQSSKQIRLSSIQKWMNGELSRKIMVGGLCGSEEFTRQIIDPRPGWTRVVALGELRLNNVGRVQVFV